MSGFIPNHLFLMVSQLDQEPAPSRTELEVALLEIPGLRIASHGSLPVGVFFGPVDQQLESFTSYQKCKS